MNTLPISHITHQHTARFSHHTLTHCSFLTAHINTLLLVHIQRSNPQLVHITHITLYASLTHTSLITEHINTLLFLHRTY